MGNSICDCTIDTCQVLRKKQGFEPLYYTVLERITSLPKQGRQEITPYAGLMMLHAYLESVKPNGHECMTTTQVKYIKEILENAVEILQSDIPKQRRSRIIETAYSSIEELLK